MATDLEKAMEELGRDALGIVAKFALGAWTALGGLVENPSTPEPDAELFTYPSSPPGSSELPRDFKTENDNGVLRVRRHSAGSQCHTDPVVLVQVGFEGGHSLTHTLRFAAHLVKAADLSDDYEDFLKVLDAVTVQD